MDDVSQAIELIQRVFGPVVIIGIFQPCPVCKGSGFVKAAKCHQRMLHVHRFITSCEVKCRRCGGWGSVSVAGARGIPGKNSFCAASWLYTHKKV